MRTIPAIMFIFQNCVCFYYIWVENVQDPSCKARAMKNRKAKDVVGNENKVLFEIKFLETSRKDNDCCLSIAIDPKVADTTYNKAASSLYRLHL